MADILCAKCGEPWDSDMVRHEMSLEERAQFLRGQGCEVCDFGRSCPHCSGTGRQKAVRNSHQCEHCLGQRYLIARQLFFTSQPEIWEYGCPPQVRQISDPQIIRTYPIETALEGKFYSIKALCPYCRPQTPDCQFCNGTGKPAYVPDGELEAAKSEIAASGADPLKILHRRRLL